MHKEETPMNPYRPLVTKVVLSFLPAVLIYIFLTVSSFGEEQYEYIKYIFLIIIPLVIYICIKDLFK